MRYRLINLTPHDITIFLPNGEKITIPKSKEVARLVTEFVNVGNINGVPVVKTEFKEIIGLPKPHPGVIYIVSTLVAQAAAKLGRRDVIAPDTSPQGAVKDENGRIIGVKRFQVF